ncbi:SusC/RagA family TonB-linked outer membrane protein [Chitinophaga lutea]|uniref:SusC/RagA family TonB-linked outer membrane protein n=1 Tax=Chitinophaga lutea TaxID=2488634 RepID=A0A3N4QD20_9BACT|nr:SusC/RagA family TonB-linked outer membrane protein [Chitinophaga lutea]RPE13857.1 SusC/RagA family TonB-linked outer membrane protein [Chitinophaga lutea]
MRKGLTALFLLLICLSGQVMAQSRTVKGKVTAAEDGTPIIGATVIAKGTNVGTVTNAEGVYSLNVPDGVDVLVVKFIGMKDTEAKINGATVNVVLGADVTTLTETVVTANAIRRDKRSLGYASPTVKNDELTKGQSSSALNALAGKVAGVNITSTASAPGSSSRIVLRGGSSITGNNQALIVVDGVPIDNSSIIGGGDSRSSIDFGNRGNDINPDDIESMTILKGPAAAALYGSRASNGAVIITTKSGKKGDNKKNEVTFNSSVTMSNILKLPTFQNEYGQGGHGTPDPRENFSWGPKLDGSMQEWGQSINGVRLKKPYVAQPDNVKKFFDLGVATNNNLSLSGATDKTTYYLSLNALNSDGVMPGSTDRYNKYSLRFNGSTELTNKITTSIGVNYSRVNSSMIQGGQGDGSVYDNVLQTARDIPLDKMGDLNNPYYSFGGFFDEEGNELYGFYGSYTTNPYYILKNFRNENIVDRVTGNFTINYKPLDWLTFTERLGGDIYSDQRKTKVPKYNYISWGTNNGYRQNDQTNGGAYGESQFNVSDITHDFMVNMKKDFSKDFTASLLLGNNVRQRVFNQLEAVTNSAGGLIVPNWYNLGNSNGPVESLNFYSKRRLVGLYAELSLAYRNMLFLGATARNDWSSTLPKGRNSFFYPSVNGAFVFTELMKDSRISEFLNYGKIRASWASVGNDADPYLLKSYYSKAVVAGGFSSTIFPLNGIPGLSLDNVIGNPNLKPEITTAFEVGTELAFWDNRASIDFSYYQNKSKDQILAIPTPASIGFTSKVTNTGVVENKGIELAARVTPIRTASGFTWELFGTYTRNKNTVVSLDNGVEQIVIGGFGGMSIVAAVGKPYGTFYAEDVLRDEQGRIVINNDGGTNLPLLTDQAQYLGSYNPKYQASWGTNLSYKGISFSVLFDTKQGGKFFSRTKDILGFVGATPETSEFGRQPYVLPNSVYLENGKYVPNTSVKTDMESWYTNQLDPSGTKVIDASYVKLREISLSYRLPKSLLSRTALGDATVGVFGNNLFLWTPKQNSFADPEINSGGAGNEQGFDFTAQPSLRNFGVNLKVSF